MIDAKLLKIKNTLAKKRPKFLRQDYHHRMRVEDDLWRRPRGRHSKMRERRAGKRKRVEIGYRGPAEVRGLHFTGLEIVNVETLAQLSKINAKEQTAVLSGNLGDRKRYQLVKVAAEKNIKLLNIKDTSKFLASIDAKLKARKASKIEKTKKTEEKKSEEKKAAKVSETPKDSTQTKPEITKAPMETRDVTKPAKSEDKK